MCESHFNVSTTTELKLRSQERARQIKKAREEFLCIPGSSDIKILVTSSVGDLPIKNQNSYWKRKLEKTIKKSVSNKESLKDMAKNKAQQNKKWQTKSSYEDYGHEILDYDEDAKHKDLYFPEDNSLPNKSYSCPSSPKL